MAVIARSIRDTIATSVGNALGAGWRETVFVPALLSRDGGGVRRYAVEVPRSTRAHEGRRGTTERMQLRTELVVRWLDRLVVDGAIDSYQDHVDRSAVVVQGILGASRSGTSGIVVDAIDVGVIQVEDQAYLVGTVTCTVQHPIEA